MVRQQFNVVDNLKAGHLVLFVFVELGCDVKITYSGELVPAPDHWVILPLACQQDGGSQGSHTNNINFYQY